jgi:hypothetical protein
MNEIFSYHEFMLLTKCTSILIALGYVVLFVMFWSYLNGKEKPGKYQLLPDDYDLFENKGPFFFAKDLVLKILGRAPEEEKK